MRCREIHDYVEDLIDRAQRGDPFSQQYCFGRSM